MILKLEWERYLRRGKKRMTRKLFQHKIFAFRDIYAHFQEIYGIIACKGIRMADISGNVLAKLGKGEFVSMESLKKICRALECDVGDIASFEEN